MKVTAIEKAVNILGASQMAELLTKAFENADPPKKFARQNIYRQVTKGYAPPDWIDIIVKATKGKVTNQQLIDDVYQYKWNCNPKDVTNQINKFLSPCQQSRQRVGKHRQKGVG